MRGGSESVSMVTGSPSLKPFVHIKMHPEDNLFIFVRHSFFQVKLDVHKSGIC
jgi:hypothetical protein